LDRRAYVNKLL
jgi:hypothetical protein